MEKYVITISKVLRGVEFPFVEQIVIYDQAMYALDAFYNVTDIYNADVLHDEPDSMFKHAVGYDKHGDKIAIELQTVYKELAEDFEYAN